MRKLNLKSVIWKEGDYYISQCLEVDVSSFGKTKNKALVNLRDALELYFKGISIPKKLEVKNPVIASVELQYA